MPKLSVSESNNGSEDHLQTFTIQPPFSRFEGRFSGLAKTGDPRDLHTVAAEGRSPTESSQDEDETGLEASDQKGAPPLDTLAETPPLETSCSTSGRERVVVAKLKRGERVTHVKKGVGEFVCVKKELPEGKVRRVTCVYVRFQEGVVKLTAREATKLLFRDRQQKEHRSSNEGPNINQGSEVRPFRLYFDGASKGNPGPAGAGAILLGPDGKMVCEIADWVGRVTNNVAEYKGLIAGLHAAVERGVKHLEVRGDSMLVCCQVTEQWKVSSPDLQPLVSEAKRLASQFDDFSIQHIRREFNHVADELANKGVQKQPIRNEVHALPLAA